MRRWRVFWQKGQKIQFTQECLAKCVLALALSSSVSFAHFFQDLITQLKSFVTFDLRPKLCSNLQIKSMSVDVHAKLTRSARECAKNVRMEFVGVRKNSLLVFYNALYKSQMDWNSLRSRITCKTPADWCTETEYFSRLRRKTRYGTVELWDAKQLLKLEFKEHVQNVMRIERYLKIRGRGCVFRKLDSSVLLH